MENYIEDLIGHVIDGYRLEAILGTGGMGVVYKARHLQTAQDVAIKILWPKDPLSPEEYENFLHRFRREAQVITQLYHPHIVRVYIYGEHDETFTGYTPLPYIVMSYIPGKTLADKLRQEGQLPLRTALSYIEQAASALMHAHRAQVTHRDLKPGNFLLDLNDKLILTDFGIAHIQGSTLTKKGEFIGTSDYAAPEVKQGGSIDTRADIYSLGVVLFEMLLGDTPAHTDQQHFVFAPEVDAIIQKAMAFRPEDRYDTPQQFAQAIHQATSLLHSAPTLLGSSTEIANPQTELSLGYPPRIRNAFFQLRFMLLGIVFAALLLILASMMGALSTHTHVDTLPNAFVLNLTPTPAINVLNQAQATVKLYYTDWARKDYTSAYALLDTTYQNQDGHSYAALLPNYQNTLLLCVTFDKVTQVSDNMVEVAITDNAVENLSDDSGQVTHLYQGFFQVTHEANGWKLMPALHLVSALGSCIHPLS